MRYGRALFKLASPMNAGVRALRSSSRWGPSVSRHITIVTYTGRRSGRTFSTPVGYRRVDDTVVIQVALPDAKTWWRNFTGTGGPIALELDGAQRAGHAVAERDDQGRVTVTVRLNG